MLSEKKSVECFGDICSADDICVPERFQVRGQNGRPHASAGRSEIILCSGDLFDLSAPDIDAITIETIAHALSNLCRFTGHTSRFYSVAQHSVLVSHMLPKPFQFAGLMHDATEAILGDVSKPLKVLLPVYQQIEKQIEILLFRRFNVPYPLPEAVKAVDKAILCFEQRDLIGFDGPGLADAVARYPDFRPITPLDPVQAKEVFLARFFKLCPEAWHA